MTATMMVMTAASLTGADRMPSGVYPRKPKPKNPLIWAKGKTIVSMEAGDWDSKIVIKLDDGSNLVFFPKMEQDMGQQFAGVHVRVEEH